MTRSSTGATNDDFEASLTDALGTALEHAHGGAPTLVTTSGLVGVHAASLLSALAIKGDLRVPIRVVGPVAKLYEALDYDCRVPEARGEHETHTPRCEWNANDYSLGVIRLMKVSIPRVGIPGLRKDPRDALKGETNIDRCPMLYVSAKERSAGLSGVPGPSGRLTWSSSRTLTFPRSTSVYVRQADVDEEGQESHQ